MTDYNVCKRNPLTGVALRMHVRNAERFGPEVHQLFKDLEHATEFPKQTSLDNFEEES